MRQGRIVVVAPNRGAARREGVDSEAPALPSCGETGEPTGADGPGLAEDVAAVRQVLTASDEPTVVVAHSYGGIVTAEAAAGVDSVRHLLLVSSYLPEVGQSLSSFGGEGPAPFLDIDPAGGTFTVRPESLAETFLQDCDPEIQRQAVDRTARQSLAVLGQPVRSAAWQHVPSTYLVCAADRGDVLGEPGSVRTRRLTGLAAAGQGRRLAGDASLGQ